MLNIEADHLDFFKDLDDVKHSFHEFAARVPEYGYVVANHDDPNTMDVVKDIEAKVITFGLHSDVDVYAENIQFIGANSSSTSCTRDICSRM